MRGEVSDTVVIIGVFILVALTVLTAFTSLDQIQLPKDTQQEIRGDSQSASRQLSRLADSCWKQSTRGQADNAINCFDVKIRSEGAIRTETIKRNAEIIGRDHIGSSSSTIPGGESTLEVSYRPKTKSVNITLVDSCKISSGETCFSTSCSCLTTCAPDFDPDGDGNANTNSKGCVQNVRFKPGDPCKPAGPLDCSDSGIYEELSISQQAIDLDMGENITLLNTTVRNLSTSYASHQILEAENRISPYEATGAGSRNRKLFQGGAMLDISGLGPDNYGLYLWTCRYQSVPENCSWNAYNFTVS